MGLWYYSYDASSNLASQTDARGCLTSISYDNYSPFNGQFGRGYRTGMTDGSGSTFWRYDPRGRLRMEEKTITGSGTFVTEWSYNSADLAAWMRYPADNAGVNPRP